MLLEGLVPRGKIAKQIHKWPARDAFAPRPVSSSYTKSIATNGLVQSRSHPESELKHKS